MAIKEGKKLHTSGSGFSPSILSSLSPCHCPRADTKTPPEQLPSHRGALWPSPQPEQSMASQPGPFQQADIL